MTAWLERHEKIERHAAVIHWRQQDHELGPESQKCLGPPRAHAQKVKMAQNPSVKATSFNVLAEHYWHH